MRRIVDFSPCRDGPPAHLRGPASGTLVGLSRSRRSFLAASLALHALRGSQRESPGVFAERRRRLASAVGRGLIALLGHGESEGQSGFTGFRQESNFYYLTGHDEPGAALLVAPARGKDPYREALFLPQRGGFAAKWSGPLLSLDGAGSLGFEEALAEESFPGELRKLIRDRKRLYGLRPRGYPETGSESLERLEDIAGTRDIRDVRAELARMRSVKSPGEIALLQGAVDATESAFRAAWTAVEAGLPERAVIAEFVGAAFRAGCERLAFPPMAGTGPNAAILHYQRNDSVMQDGQLLLMDAGVECTRYAADIARTIPVSGTFSAEQRRLYDLALGARRAAVAAARPGATLGGSGPDSLTSVAERYMRDRAPTGVDTRLPHAIGHHVGLDVHDPAPLRSPLQRGMVVAIEPGVYVPERGLGIRVEDMVEITDEGCRMMSGGLPDSADGIEKALAAGRPEAAQPKRVAE